MSDPAALDTGRLSPWLSDNVEGFKGPVTVKRFSGGQSNPTFRLETPDASYVLRRKPLGVLLRGAHAIDREYRVIAALHAAGFAVPRPFALCADDNVIGSAFYIMDHVEGRIFWDTTFPDVPVEQRVLYFNAMNATLAHLHNIDPIKAGLADFGRTGGYFGRQIKRWSEQYLADTDAGRVPELDRLVEWLPAHLPEGDESAIVHGDYRCDNMIFDPSEPHVLAVLDWELSTIGHPLADFTYHAMMYRLPPRFSAGLIGYDLDALNIPSEADYIAAYCSRTGRSEIDHYNFYITYNMFRLAAIYHGIKGRALRGTAASAEALRMASNVESLAELAWQQALQS